MVKILRVNPRNPERALIAKAAAILGKGGVLAFPTETVYGLGANAFDKNAAARIFRAKGRPEQKPLIILIASIRDLRKVARKVPPAAKKLISRFWPGPLTIIFKKRANIPMVVSGGLDTVGVRLSPHPISIALVRAAGFPITAPSANRSGGKNHRTASGVIRDLGGAPEIDLIVDGGKTPLAKPSTLVDVTKNPPRILREGAISAKKIAQALRSR